MANQIPIKNFVVHIVRDESYYLSNTVEHIVMIHELVQEQENVEGIENVVADLNKVYENIQKSIPLLDRLENNALNGQNHPKFAYELCEECCSALQDLSNTTIQFLQILGQLEEKCEKNLFLLMIRHITIEEKYGLEILSGYISQIASYGFGI